VTMLAPYSRKGKSEKDNDSVEDVLIIFEVLCLSNERAREDPRRKLALLLRRQLYICPEQSRATLFPQNQASICTCPVSS